MWFDLAKLGSKDSSFSMIDTKSKLKIYQFMTKIVKYSGVSTYFFKFLNIVETLQLLYFIINAIDPSPFKDSAISSITQVTSFVVVNSQKFNF